MTEADECIHLLDPATCGICSPRPKATSISQGFRADLTRSMHLIVKWSPERESDTADQHRRVAKATGATWWGCDSIDPSRRAAPERIVQLRGQLAAGVDTHAYVYRSGAATQAEAEVWLTDVCDVTDDEVEVEREHRPRGMPLESSFLFVKLKDFRPFKGDLLEELDLWDPTKTLQAGSLGNQTSPLYVCMRGE